MAQDIKEYLKEKKTEVELAEAVERLRENPDFTKVIEKAFYEREPMRCAMLKARPTMKSVDSQRMLDARIISVGELENFLQTLSAIGNLALKAIEEAEELPDDAEYEVVE